MISLSSNKLQNTINLHYRKEIFYPLRKVEISCDFLFHNTLPHPQNKYLYMLFQFAFPTVKTDWPNTLGSRIT
jgi:hypothetical protein